MAIPCHLGTCLAFKDYRYRPLWIFPGGHAQVIGFDGRKAWNNPFEDMIISEITADFHGQITVRAHERRSSLFAKDIRFDHFAVVDLMTQQVIYRSTHSSGELGYHFQDIRSLGNELFLGLGDLNIKLLHSNGEAIGFPPIQSS